MDALRALSDTSFCMPLCTRVHAHTAPDGCTMYMRAVVCMGVMLDIMSVM